MSTDDKPLPDNVIPFGKKDNVETVPVKSTTEEGANLEEQNKERYNKLQEFARQRRLDNNRNVTRSYNLTPRNPDRRK